MRKLKNSELNRLSNEDFKNTDKTPLMVILDNVRSLNNIGSVFRTADAFLIEKIWLCGITATPPHKDIHKTALGATESVEWAYEKDTLTLVEKLKKEDVVIMALEQAVNATELQHYKPEPGKKYALVLGNEVKGVSQQVVSAAHLVLEIPQYGTKHSLNIAVSAGVALWDIFSKLRRLQ